LRAFLTVNYTILVEKVLNSKWMWQKKHKKKKFSRKYFLWLENPNVLFELIRKIWNKILLCIHQITTEHSVILISAHKIIQLVLTNRVLIQLQNSEFVFLYLIQLTTEFTQWCLSVKAGPLKYVTRKNMFYCSPIGVYHVDLPDLCKYSKFHESVFNLSGIVQCQ